MFLVFFAVIRSWDTPIDDGHSYRFQCQDEKLCNGSHNFKRLNAFLF